MNADLLLAHFDRISEAPDALGRLRGFILDLAVRGKLIEQDPNDEPAVSLLGKIRAQKGQLGIPTDAELIPADERPFEIPPNWIWLRLGDVCSKTGSGSTPRGGKAVYQRDGVPFLRSQNVHDDGLRLDDVAYITTETHEKMSGTALRPGDLLLNITGGSIGRCCILPAGIGPANVSQHVAIIRVAIDGMERFLHQLVLSPYFQSFVLSEQTGAGRGGLPKNRMDRIPVALPPLGEQNRVVSKVQELMALCDQLDRAQHTRESRRTQLGASALHYLNNGSTVEQIREYGRFYINHLPDVSFHPEQIPQMRQTILSLAVRGDLVPQAPGDEPAVELLKRIHIEKARCVQQGSLRKEKPLAEIAEQQKPFELPGNWRWTRIGTCAWGTEYGTSVKSDQIEDGVPVLAMGDIQDGRVILNARKKVRRQIEDLPRLFLQRFDLLYNRTNSAELVGKTGIYLGDDDAYTFASYLIRIRFFSDLVSPAYVNIAMNAPYFRKTQIIPELRQQCGQANVNGSKLRNMIIPLPPIAEQRSIVEKVDELLGLCDQLESQITGAQERTKDLLESVLYHALNDSNPVAQAECSVLFEARHTGTA
jgi:type I restriction enzyme S subunit